MSVIRAALLIVAGGIIGAGAYHFYDTNTFPVLSETCTKVDGWCYPYAKYTDWQSCQRENDMGSMLCDRTDPAKIVCTPNTDPLSVSQCLRR